MKIRNAVSLNPKPAGNFSAKSPTSSPRVRYHFRTPCVFPPPILDCWSSPQSCRTADSDRGGVPRPGPDDETTLALRGEGVGVVHWSADPWLIYFRTVKTRVSGQKRGGSRIRKNDPCVEPMCCLDSQEARRLIWPAVGQHFSASTFPEFVATYSCEVQTGSARSLKQKTLNHWVVGSIPTRCIPSQEAPRLDSQGSPLFPISAGQIEFAISLPFLRRQKSLFNVPLCPSRCPRSPLTPPIRRPPPGHH
jgi:hypothetical protein